MDVPSASYGLMRVFQGPERNADHMDRPEMRRTVHMLALLDGVPRCRTQGLTSVIDPGASNYTRLVLW